jgi:hypothetical protein
MNNADKSLFDLFNKSLSQKLFSTLEKLYPGSNLCLLLLSKSYEPLSYNPVILQSLETSKVRIKFL